MTNMSMYNTVVQKNTNVVQLNSDSGVAFVLEAELLE